MPRRRTLALIVLIVGMAAGYGVLCFIAGRASSAPARTATAAQRIDQVLATYRSPMAGLGRVFVAAGRQHRVSPYLIVAISGVESTFGREACGRNAFGWESCQGRGFPSWDTGIWTVARALRAGYLDHGVTSLEQLGRVYCPPCGPRWARDVSWIMRHLLHADPTRLDR